MVKGLTDNKEDLIKLIKNSFEDIIYNTYNAESNNIKVDDELLNWAYLKLNILIKNQFLDLIIEKNYKVDGLLTTKQYDLVIRSKSLNRIVLVISLNKIFNNTNKTFYNLYKDIIFHTVNLGTKNIPYYSLIISPLNNITDKGQNEMFSAKNLLRVFNGNKASNITGITKVILINGNIKEKKFNILSDVNEFILNKNISRALNNGVILNDIKYFFSDIYNIIQKYN